MKISSNKFSNSNPTSRVIKKKYLFDIIVITTLLIKSVFQELLNLIKNESSK